jgi:phosphate transport system ATP-binding protein
MVAGMTTPIRFEHVTVNYGRRTVLSDVCLEMLPRQILGIIGPNNSGKTTVLKCINRTLELAPNARLKGRVLLGGENVYAIRNVYQLRRRVGMVFPLPVGLPLSVYENVAYAPRRAGIRDRGQLGEIVERCLRQSMLWDEVKDRLDILGTKLSGGQQQRLTLARALSLSPQVLCLDEFSIAIDPVTTMRIEDILRELKSQMTIVLVTNLVQQARRLADRTAFFSDGRLIEVADTETVFQRPSNRLTERYVNGDFG